MRMLRQPDLDRDGFTVAQLDGLDKKEFQHLHQAVYGAFRPGENASNKLARAVRFGIFAHQQFLWFGRNTYTLPKEFNPEEEGRVRRFGLIPEHYLRSFEVDRLLRQTYMMWNFPQTSSDRGYEAQVSAIRYQPTIATTAIPSPITPHQDLVDGAVVVMSKTAHLVGGTSRLYALNDEPLYELDLQVGEALLIRDAKLKHQVTPLQLVPGSTWRPGTPVYRDILIVRFQPVGR